MSSQLIINATLVNVRDTSPVLRGKDLAELPCIKDGWLLIEDGEIAGLGSMDALPASLAGMARGERYSGGPASVIDGAGRFVLPAWCDSHTHLVFAGSRETEFVDKL
ncbi:MAG TPA: hypothetical protein VHC48_21430, partial [Puia sp.]|nr:hypothetical protein [Puia sp.]